MDKLRKALSGQEEEEEERGFVAQVENNEEFFIITHSYSYHLFRLWTPPVCLGTLGSRVSVYVLVSVSSALSWAPSS